MIVNFIGHGLDPSNKLTVGNILTKSFEESKFQKFYGFVAFASVSGVKKIITSIEKNKEKFNEICFYIGVDENGTSKESLEELLEKQIETYIFHTISTQIYHPKIFVFEGNKWNRIIIGSNNLTSYGLFVNIEGAVSIEFRNTDLQGIKLLNQIKYYFENLLNKSHQNLKRLDENLLQELVQNELVIPEFKTRELKQNDSEEFKIQEFPELEKLDIKTSLESEIDTLNDDDEIIRNYDLKFTKNDENKFPYFLEKWINYRDENPSSGGIVSKLTDERDLLGWYQDIKRMVGREIDIPQYILKQLEDNKFPFENGQFVRSRIIWNERFEELVDYMKTNNLNYAHVPQTKDRNNPNYSLGGWCARQRLRKKGLLPPTWKQYEEDKLDSINFMWISPSKSGLGTTPNDETWLENYFKLEDYKIEFGNANPSQTDKNPEIKKLAKWVNDQRTLNNTGRAKKNGTVRKLLPERYELLLELGVDFDYQLNIRKQELERFIESYIKMREIYPDEKPKGDNRFKKVLEQKANIRHKYKNDNSESNKWRIDRLNEIGFTWD